MRKMKADFFTEGTISLPYNGVSKGKLAVYLKKIFKSLKLENISISIIICDNDYIKKINKKYRKKNKSTDVIAFSYRENPFPAVKLDSEPLGDIYISLEKADENAMVYEVSLIDEIKRLLVHGVLHLIGFDHEKSGKDEKIMRKKEEEILYTLTNTGLK